MKRFFPIAILLISFAPFLLFINATDEDAVAKKKAADDYRTGFVGTKIASAEDLGWTGKAKSCKPGKVSYPTYVKIITRINYFRRLAGVSDQVVLDSTWNKYAQAAALIMSSNNTLNHHPTDALKCYSEDGKLGAETSNLSSIVEKSIELLIADEIQDGSSSNKDCGHRRWLLYSQAYKMGFGATPGAYAVRVNKLYDEEPKDTSKFHGKVPEYFGYPFKGFVPYQVVYPKWSFAIPGGADFSLAILEVKAGGKPLEVSVLSRGRVNYGDPTLVWTVKGLKEDFDYDYYDMSVKRKGFESVGLLNKKVTVTVSNVKVGGKMKSYSYSFTIFDPDDVQ